MINYIRSKIIYLLTIIIVILVFNINLFLYQINMEVLLYGNLIALFLTILMIVIDYYRYSNHLKEVVNNKDVIDCEFNVDAKDEIENTYQEMISSLKRSIVEINDKNAIDKEAMVDYYTMWVHQIKTPIAAMKLILEEKNDIDLSIELLKVEQYVQMVLSYLRLNSESSDYVFREVNLNEIIKENIKAYRMIFIKKKIQIDYKEVNYSCISDDKWLSFAIGQVLSNALKYSKNSSTIKIELNGDVLSIIDEGIGINETDLPRIFEKGYSGYQGREDKKATGIGLYLTKNILDRLNHPILIESKVNVGTKVSIKLIKENKIFD